MTEMTYQDWIARGNEACNAECAEAMGWTRDDSEVGSYWLGPDSTGMAVWAWSPTTNRNHTAMMVERVVERGRARIVSLHGYLRDHVVFDDDLPNSIFWLRINSAIVAWACWRVLRPDLAASGADSGVSGHKGTKEEA